MKAILVLVAVQALLGSSTGAAHPASGIVVDPQGQIYFIYSGHGVCRLDGQGKLVYIHRTSGGHWMCLDPQGSFSHAQPRHFQRITPEGVKPAIIFADGGSPIAVLPSGDLYYVSGESSLNPGGVRITRNTPGGELSPVVSKVNAITGQLGVTGLAAGSGDALYIACPNAVMKLNMDGTFSTLAGPIRLPDCDVDYPDNNTNNALPYLRGLAVDKQGTVFAAGTACHCVLKVTPAGKVESILKSELPWSPTGVAVQEADVYVLEYTHATEAAVKGWLPRVRKIAGSGTVTTLVTVTPERQIPAEE